MNYSSPELLLPKMIKVLQLTSTSEKASLLRFRRFTVFIQLLIDLPPTRKPAEVAVVNEQVCMDFSAYV